MILSAAVMAHPQRRGTALELADMLGKDVQVILDEHREPSRDPERRWATGRRAWLAHDPRADWHLVVQDDAIPCYDVLDGLERALDRVGTSGVVSAYTGAGRPDQNRVKHAVAEVRETGDSWLWLPTVLWGVAIAAPTWTIPHMIQWCDEWRGSNYDYRIGRYFYEVWGWRAWYTHPSLLDHRNERSLVGHGHGACRIAHEFDPEVSALDVDWDLVPEGGLDIKLPEEFTRVG